MIRTLLSILFLLFPITASAQLIDRIAFGSCVHQDKPQPIWSEVLVADPDLFIFLGDNIYGDSDDPAVLAAKYEQLAAKPGFQELIASTEVIATWDDHDYGQNDIGANYIAKEASRKLMLDFFDEPGDSERRTQAGGIYTSYLYTDNDKSLQIILLDLRWNRTALTEIADPVVLEEREAQQRGPYEASLAADARLLGEYQWQWLEEQMQVPADVRIIGSSIQLLAEFTGWETWANYPKDRQRFFELLAEYQREPILIISGDVHWAELSEINTTNNDWPLIELTSSGLTEEWSEISPNRHRVGPAFAEANFGLIEIDWTQMPPALDLEIRSEAGDTLISRGLRF